MYYKPIMVSYDEEKTGKIAEILSYLNCEHPNSFPNNWREITEKEFIQNTLWSSYTPEFVSPSRFMLSDNPKMSVTATLYFYYDKTGVAIQSDYWAGKLKFFAFGCKHDNRELSMKECREKNIWHAGNCWHVYLCKKCGHIEGHDSSD